MDNAQVLGDRADAVRRAANRLGRVVYLSTVRVRVYRALPTVGLDDQEHADLSACPDWRLDPSTRTADPGLLVLAISAPDRTSNLYYGEDWSDDLASGWPTVHDAIRRGLAHGGYAAGLVAGLTAIRTAASNGGFGHHSLSGTRQLLLVAGLVFLCPVVVATAIVVVRRRRYANASTLHPSRNALDGVRDQSGGPG